MPDLSLGGSSVAFVPNSSTSLESARILKNDYCNLYHLNCFSTTAGFILVLDDTNIPSSGATVIPKLVYALPANGTVAFTWEVPIRFTKGCTILFSTNTSPFTYTSSNTAFISGGAI